VLELSLKALQIVLGLGALALAGTTLVSFASSTPPGEAPSSIDAGALQPDQASLPRYRVIADRNLFKVKDKPVAAPVEPSIEESKLQVKLLGTVVAQLGASGEPEKGSLAILRDTNNDVLTLGIGESFAEQRAKLVRVEPRRIVIEVAGRLEAVQLAEDAQTATAPTRRASVPGAASMNMVQEAARNMAQGNGPDGVMANALRSLGSQMVASVERDASGRLSGFRIQRINDGSPLQGLGLQPGDSIKGINGQSLSGDAAAVQLFASMSGGAPTVLTVQRADGQSLQVPVPPDVLRQVLSQQR
jgi:type II secretion system protein C